MILPIDAKSLEQSQTPTISIVTTLYHSAAYLYEFHARITKAVSQLTENYEIIFVNDGSPDDSLNVSKQIQAQDPCMTVIDLSKNFGHYSAILTGLAHASGDYIFLIDSDLEEDPELLIDFYQQLHLEQADVVYGVQTKRKGNWFERFSGFLFYKVMNFICDIKLPTNLSTIRLMTKRYVNALMTYQEREVALACLWAATGFKQVPRDFTKKNTSPTTYSFAKKITLFLNFLTAFSSKPLVGIFYLGLGILTLSSLYICYLLIQHFYIKAPISGWTSLITSIWFFCGLTNFSIGILGIYLSKVYLETKQRPRSIIREIYSTKSLVNKEY